MRRILILTGLLALTLAGAAAARTGAAATSTEPFKLGTFEVDGEAVIGLVLRNDTLVVELDAANRALERDPAYPRVPMPATMRELVGQYEYGLKHRLYELIEYASSIVTLFPGDVLNNGTSGGVGMGSAVRGAPQYLKPGDEIVASIDGIGTLTLPVVAGAEPPPGTGAYLPPVSTYRRPQDR